MSENQEGKSPKESAVINVDRKAVGPMGVDQEGERGSSKRPASNDAQSPVRQRVAPGTVDIDTLRALLADQSAMLLEQQRCNMADMMSSIRDEMRGSEAKIMDKVQEHHKQLADLQDGQQSMKERLQALENGTKKVSRV